MGATVGWGGGDPGHGQPWGRDPDGCPHGVGTWGPWSWSTMGQGP